MAAREPIGHSRLAEVDVALVEWRQGDCVLGEAWFVHRPRPDCPLANSSLAAAAEGNELVESEVPGLVVLTQTCDIVRPCAVRPFLEVGPLVEVDDERRLRKIERGMRPRYASVPSLADRRLVADLDRVMTVEKPVVGALFAILRQHVLERDLGEVLVSPLDVILSKRSAPQPDIVFVAREREERVSDRGIEGAPTLVVEVLSPSRPALDRVKKRKLYFENAIPHYWIADPEKTTLEGLVPGSGDYAIEARFEGDGTAVLQPFPDLVIPLSELWMPRRKPRPPR